MAEEFISHTELAKIRAGDEHALANVYARAEPIIRGVVHHLLQPPEADEVVEAVMLRILKLIRTNDWSPPPIALEAWVSKVARNYTVQCARRAHKHAMAVDEVETELAARSPSPLENLEADELAGKLNAAIQELSGIERAVVLLHAEGLTFREIAESLGMPRSSMYSYYSRASRKIRGLLANDG